uniref:Bryoporin n=1 Tax=Physcomitrium patens TaxID=3218 RepID=UPI0021C4C949|nr:Chain A, Bryoporin [Physcomitrium patens]
MAEAIIPAAELSIKTLQNIVEGITGVDRKIAIGFKNLTDYTLENLGVYFNSGSSDRSIAYKINAQEALLFSARKSDHTARGTVGTFSYYIQDEDKTVHVMWSVPFDYNLYSNWWNIAVVDGRQPPDSNVHDNLYNGSGGMPYPNKPDQYINNEQKGFHLFGSMTNNGQATIEVELKKAKLAAALEHHHHHH